jgi:hypothetical protein
MKNAWWAMGGLALCALPAQAQVNQQWLEFRNETGTRLQAAAGLGASDPEEKDYAWGDVNHDGWIDLVVVRKEPFTTPGRRPNVLFINENGVLTDRTTEFASESDVPGDQGFLTATNDRDVVLADFNNDGWLDIATAVTISDVPLPVQPKHISHPRIYMNKGAIGGVWQGFRFEAGRSPQLYVLQSNGQPDLAQPYPGRFCSIAAGDVDNDGDQDLYLGDYDAGSFDNGEPAGKDLNDRLWINDGTGVFTDSYRTRMDVNMLSSAFSTAAAIADMNGDGLMDIVKDTGLNADIVGPQSVRIAYNRAVTPPPGCSSADPTKCFDILQRPHNFAPYFVSVGDLNNDNRLDMVVTDDNEDRYRLNTGNDALGQVVWDPTAFVVQRVSTENQTGEFGSQSLIDDLDQDGFRDVLISDVDVDDDSGSGGTGVSCGSGVPTRRLHIYRNLGNVPNVTLKEEAQQTTASSGWKGAVGLTVPDLRGTYNVAAFDVDRDGDDDLVLGRTCSTSVWANTSRSRYGTAAENSTGAAARAWATGLVAATSTNLVVRASGLPPNAQGVFVFSAEKLDPCVSEDAGFRCVGPEKERFRTLGRANANANGDASLAVSLTAGPLAGIAPGSIRFVQYRYADPGAAPGVFNFSDGLELRFRP